jgi:hypothetical protein
MLTFIAGVNVCCMKYAGHSTEVPTLNLSDMWIGFWSLNCFVKCKMPRCGHRQQMKC